jgi:hypothetical protein
MCSALAVLIGYATERAPTFVHDDKMLARFVRAQLGARRALANQLPASHAGLFQTI